MEVLDKKVQETPLVNPPLKDDSNVTSKVTDEPSEKIAVENGGTKKEVKNENNKLETINSNKQTEATGGKQNNSKAGDTKKSSRDEKYSRRKDERSVEQVMRALNSFESPQDKLDALVKKYAEVIDENRKLQLQSKNFERRLSQVEREKDSAQSEHSKAVLTRSRLEGLCRELQRQNKAIKEESLLRIREEEEKRKEVSNKFQNTLAEITSLMQQNNEKNSKLRDDNIEMTTKFKSVCEQYELRVQQVEKISKQMQLEAQLADAKLAKAHLEAKAEKEAMLREKQEILIELAKYQQRAKEQTQTEIELRGQVELYTNKYDEFQTALSRSNEVFGGFKEEMERMSKKIVKLEKETSTWKMRWEKSHQALLEMATDKQQRDAELALANRQLTQLHKLCRTLTEERAKLMAQINAADAPVDAGKEEKLAADIADDRRKLNDTLDSLQSVILERELLHKQQQLEKQQQQLQMELQKHVTATVETSGKAPVSKSSDTKSAESKSGDSKTADVKASGNKNADGSKKKGKKQKPGRQAGGKQESSEEIKPDANEPETATPPEEIIPCQIPAQSAAVLPEGLSPPGEAASADSPVTSEPVAKQSPVASPAPPLASEPVAIQSPVASPAPPAAEATLEKEPEPKVDVNIADPLVSSKPEINPKVQGIQVTAQTESPAQPSTVSASDPANAPSAFSYAAAVGSKPSEHSVTDKAQTDKTEEKPVEKTADPKVQVAVPEDGTVTTSASIDMSSSVEAINGVTKPVGSEKLTLSNENTSCVASPSVSPPKKSKVN